MTSVYEIIQDAVIVEKGKGIVKNTTVNFFSSLRTTVTENKFTSREAWEEYLKPDEDRWMEDNFGSDPDAKHKGGKVRAGTWKYRSYMPNPYTSAKSVLGSCLDKGIDVTGRGKSELQGMLTGKDGKDTESTATVSSNLDKFKKSWLKCGTYYSSMTSEERQKAYEFIGNNTIVNIS